MTAPTAGRVIGKPKPAKRLVLTGVALKHRRDAIWAREQGRCALCGRHIRSDYSIHHRLPRGRGGGDEISNGVLLCGTGTTGCHGWMTEHPGDFYDVGFILPTSNQPDQAPAAVAIRHAVWGVVTLADDGRVLATSSQRVDRVEAAFTRIKRPTRT